MKDFFNKISSFFNEVWFSYGEDGTKTFSPKTLLLIILTVVFAILIIKSLRIVTKRYMSNRSDSVGRVDSFIQIQKYIIWFIAFLVFLKLLKVDISNIIVTGSAVIVIISFGLQSLFTDFISGIIILFDGTIKSNDIIEVGDTIGKVKKITLRNTTLITREDYVIIMPNKKFITENVTNWSHDNNTMRFYIEVGVAYGSDTKLVSKLMLACLNEHSLVNNSKKGIVMFKNFGESALVFELHFWTSEIFRIEILKSDLRFMIDKAFRENGIKIPFPQRDIHVIEANDNETK